MTNKKGERLEEEEAGALAAKVCPDCGDSIVEAPPLDFPGRVWLCYAPECGSRFGEVSGGFVRQTDASPLWVID